MVSEKQVPDVLIRLAKEAETKFDRKVEIIQSDYSTVNSQSRLREELVGTKPQFSTPHEKQQNGFCERNIQTWKGVRRAITEHAGMSSVTNLWPYGAQHAAHIMNVFPKIQFDKTHISANGKWESRDMTEEQNELLVYGCLVWASVGNNLPRTERCVYLGSGRDHGVKASVVLVIDRRKVFFSRNIKGDESTLPFRIANALPRPNPEDYTSERVLGRDRSVSSDELDNDIERASEGFYNPVTVIEQQIEPLVEIPRATTDIVEQKYHENDVENENGHGNHNESHDSVLPDTPRPDKYGPGRDSGAKQYEEFRPSQVPRENSPTPVNECAENFGGDIAEENTPPRRSTRIAGRNIPPLEPMEPIEKIVVNSNHTKTKVKKFNPKTNKMSKGLPKIPNIGKLAESLDFDQWVASMMREWKQHVTIPSLEACDKEVAASYDTEVGYSLWVFDLKLDPDDPTKISRELDENGMCLGFKARLVYQGSQREVGVDHTYTEVYATVLKVRSLRIMLTCALNHDDYKIIRIHHEDIKTAFLSATLNKVVFMNYPRGIKNPGNKILKVVKALYGLPESMRIFTDHLNVKLLSMGFVQSKADNAIYILNRGKSFIWLPVFVDDMFLAENDTKLYQSVMAELEKDFTIKHLGELKYALGIRFNINLPEGYVEMDQQAQKERLIEISGLTNCKPAKAPFPKGMVLEKLDCLATKEDIAAAKTF